MFLLKTPAAWIPIALSLVVLGTILIAFSISTPVREPDEGVGAHLFQIWLALEVIMIALFAARWLEKKPKEAMLIILFQMVAVIAACAPVFYFNL